ncbi:MAG: DUF1993 family protein [Phenylobacterium sp.]|jgi:hypothetical protein
MAISLYDVSVGSMLQTVGAVSAFVEKGRAWCSEAGVDPDDVVESRLAADMFPFRFQLLSVVHHSINAIEGARAGVFGPPAPQDLDYAGLQALVADALARLKALSTDEVNALEGRDVVFKLGQSQIPFTAEGFLMSFSLPNLHFHAATAYDILRQKGAPLGKRDYLGAMKIRA